MISTIPPEKIFKSYDIRGIYPQDLNEDFAVPIIKAIYKVIQEQLQTDEPLTVAVGRDMRLSSPAIFAAVSKTLVELGANVIDLGVVSTPTFYFAVFNNYYLFFNNRMDFACYVSEKYFLSQHLAFH